MDRADSTDAHLIEHKLRQEELLRGRFLHVVRDRSLDSVALANALTAAGIMRDDIRSDNLGTLVDVAGESAAALLLARLVAEGVPITAFGPAVGDLEHTFLDLNRPQDPMAAPESAPAPAQLPTHREATS